MSDKIIHISNLSKKYTIQHQYKEGYTNLRDVITRNALLIGKKIFHPFHRPLSDQTREDIWALKDINLEINQGEVIGIIGRNGAGKTTLLKIISRITEPTSGRIHIKGRVASLLEVGTGFHPELTGRENIFLNGAILGMYKEEIKRKFDEIVAFSEIEKFLDTPVKRYSSGMYVRLAFSVAAHLEPEILVVDEVLAVGDTAFQKKCLGKMGAVAQEGRTILFVSHNMNAIQNLCERGLVLQNGEVMYSGNTGETIDKYLRSTISHDYGFVDLTTNPGRLPGMQSVIKSLIMRSNNSKEPQNSIKTGDSITFEIHYDCGDMSLDYGVIGICSSLGERIATVGTHLCPDFNKVMTGQGVLECTITDLPLAEGEYNIFIALGTRIPIRNVDCIENALSFRVETSDYFGTGRSLLPSQGYLTQRSQWKISQ